MRKIQLVSIFWLFVASTPLLAATISVEPATLGVTAGQSFVLTVQVSGAADLYGYQFDVGFNSAVVAATSVTEGPFLAGGGPTVFVPGTIDNVGGSISANADILEGVVSGVNGSGTLLDVSFKALAAGSSTVQLFNVIALNSFGQGLTLTTSSSTVTVTASGTPEPGTSLLLGCGILGLFTAGGLRVRTQHKS